MHIKQIVCYVNYLNNKKFHDLTLNIRNGLSKYEIEQIEFKTLSKPFFFQLFFL